MNFGTCGLARGLAELGDRMKLTDRRLLVDEGKDDPLHDDEQDLLSAAPGTDVWGIEKLDVVDVVGGVAADVLLGEEACGAKQLDMIRVRGRKQLSDQ